MSDVLVCYATSEGQTARVAERLSERLTADGHQVTRVDLGSPPPALAVETFDAVVVAGSIHVGRHQSAVVDFASRHQAALETRPTALVQVSLSSASDDPQRQADAQAYVDDLMEATGWTPDRVALVAGAVRYSEYGFLTRLAMKHIAAEATGDTDTSRDYEYTDWDAVDAFADAFAAVVADETPADGEAEPPSA